jgi:hypothetical protein
MHYHTLIRTGLIILASLTPFAAHAAGISVSGGGKKTVGQSITLTVTASGTTFDSLQGTISASGPISITSVTPGSATWLPDKAPKASGQFVGITSATSSLRVATITVKVTGEGTGTVSVSDVRLAKAGAVVGTNSGSTTITGERQPVVPGAITVSSSTHPDQKAAHPTSTAELSWTLPGGVTAIATAFDKSEGTVPTKEQSPSSSAKFEGLSLGTHYFHIRAKNADGWGPTTHYTISVREPDPVIDTALGAPTLARITKLKEFSTDLQAGTLSGLQISGTGPAGFTLTIASTPSLGELKTTVSEAGTWELPLPQGIKAGFYTLSLQAQKERTLSPKLESVELELSIAKGGSAVLISSTDAVPTPTPPTSANVIPPQKTQSFVTENLRQNWSLYTGMLIVIASLSAALIVSIISRRSLAAQEEQHR